MNERSTLICRSVPSIYITSIQFLSLSFLIQNQPHEQNESYCMHVKVVIKFELSNLDSHVN
jgi:hypothetical protein